MREWKIDYEVKHKHRQHLLIKGERLLDFLKQGTDILEIFPL